MPGAPRRFLDRRRGTVQRQCPWPVQAEHVRHRRPHARSTGWRCCAEPEQQQRRPFGVGAAFAFASKLMRGGDALEKPFASPLSRISCEHTFPRLSATDAACSAELTVLFFDASCPRLALISRQDAPRTIFR